MVQSGRGLAAAVVVSYRPVESGVRPSDKLAVKKMAMSAAEEWARDFYTGLFVDDRIPIIYLVRDPNQTYPPRKTGQIMKC